MSLTGQIISKNLARRIQVKTGLWINPEKDSGCEQVAGHCASLKLFCQDVSAFNYHHATNKDTIFGAFPRQTEKFDWIILSLPRQKALLQLLLDCAKGLLATEGVLWLAGENKAGIKSADKLLNAHFNHVQKLDNARHCTLFEASDPLIKQPFDSAEYREIWSLESAGKALEIVSYPGVFAHGHLDAGSEFLLQHLPQLSIDDSVLDFGCGSGAIGASIARQCPADVTFLDTNAIALHACKETLARNDLDGTLVASDGLSNLESRFDLIISNPPIHSGVKTDNHLSMRLLEEVKNHLHPSGQLLIVANRHLPYENWLAERFSQVNEMAANQHFKVLRAE